MSTISEKTQCLNCQNELDKEAVYCPKCGQKNEESIITFTELVTDFLGSFFSFDTKAIKSLPKLLFKPGALTNEYIAGKRASYLAPFRLYLFISIVLFLVLPLVINFDKISSTNIPDASNLDSLAIEVISGVDSILVANEVDEESGTSIFKLDVDSADANLLFGASDDMLEEGYSVEEVVDSLYGDNGKVAKFFLSQSLKLYNQKAKGLTPILLNTVSYSLFFFLPLFALILKLLYFRRKRFYIEHLVFSLHLFSFFFFVLLLYIGIIKGIHSIPFWPVSIFIAVYLYAALKVVYKQGWGKTLVKWITLNLLASVFLFIPFVIIALAITFIFY